MAYHYSPHPLPPPPLQKPLTLRHMPFAPPHCAPNGLIRNGLTVPHLSPAVCRHVPHDSTAGLIVRIACTARATAAVCNKGVVSCQLAHHSSAPRAMPERATDLLRKHLRAAPHRCWAHIPIYEL